jgi:hypothetical protein
VPSGIRHANQERLRYDRRFYSNGRRLLSRSLIAFLLFCVLLLAGSGWLVWYVGPTVTGIAFDSERREQPYFLLNLTPPSLEVDPAAVAEHRSRLLELVVADGGRLLWSAGTTRRHESRALRGSFRGPMEHLDLVAFARGGDLVQMLTGAPLRQLVREAPGPNWAVGSAVPPADLIRGEVTVVVLYHAVADGPLEPLGAPGHAGWLLALDDYGGRRVWDAPVDWVRGREQWNRVLMLQFADAMAASAWLRDPVTLTERAIASRHLGDLLVLVAFPAD